MVARDAGRQTSSVRAWYASRPYRLTAVGLFLLGSAAGALTIVGPSDGPRDVLTAFAGVGLFGALLLFFLRPSATSATDPVEEVYRAYAANADALARNVDLGERRVYAPTTYATEGFTAVALTVPTEERERVSIDRNRRPVFGTADHGDWSAITLYPTGAALFDAFEGMVVADLSTDPVELATQLADGLVLGLPRARVALGPLVDVDDVDAGGVEHELSAVAELDAVERLASGSGVPAGPIPTVLPAEAGDVGDLGEVGQELRLERFADPDGRRRLDNLLVLARDTEVEMALAVRDCPEDFVLVPRTTVLPGDVDGLHLEVARLRYAEVGETTTEGAAEPECEGAGEESPS